MPEPSEAEKTRVLVATCFGHAMTHLYMLAFPALVMPLREELGLSLAHAFDLSFLGFLLYGLGSLPAGMIADRWSARWMLTLCLGLSGGGAVLAGLSPSAGWLVPALALVGLGASIYHPTGMALISRTFTGRRGRALGLNGVFGNVGLASSPFVTGLLAASFGWRWAYLSLGVVGLIGAAWVSTIRVDAARESEPAAPTGSVRDDLRRYFVLLCVAMTLGGLAYRASSVFMPTYFEARAPFFVAPVERALGWVSATGAETAAATILTSLVYVVGIGGQMIGGRVADGRELRLSYLAFHLGTLLPLVGMMMWSDLPLLGAAMIYILFGLGMQPIENSLVAKLTPAPWRSTAYGLKFVLTFGVGSLSVFAVGRLEAAAGAGAVFGAVALLELMLAGAALVLWQHSRRTLPRVANA